MTKKLLACAAAAAVTLSGSLYLATPAQASALAGCPTGWETSCGVAPLGCTVTATCVTGNGGTQFVRCTVKC